MQKIFKIFARSSLCFVGAFFFALIFLVSPVMAGTASCGETIYHNYTVSFSGDCGITITGLTKTVDGAASNTGTKSYSVSYHINSGGSQSFSIPINILPTARTGDIVTSSLNVDSFKPDVSGCSISFQRYASGKTDIVCAFCGDGIKNGSEECDKNSGYCASGVCLSDCTCKPVAPKICGDGIKQTPNDQGFNEECDKSSGSCASGVCLSNCTCKPTTLTYCGDGIVQRPNSAGVYEICDGADDSACPGICSLGLCQSDCTCKPPSSLTRCGDNIVQKPNDAGVYEVCDGISDKACPGKCLSNCTCPPGGDGDGEGSSSSGSGSGSSSGSGSGSSSGSGSGSSSGSGSGSSSSGSGSGSSSSGSGSGSSSGSGSGGSSSGSGSGGSSSGSGSGGSSSGSGSGGSGSGSGGTSTGSGSGGGGCSFDIECQELPMDCYLTTLPIQNGEVAVPVDISNVGGSCFNQADVCVQVASRPIVANNVYDIRGASWSACLPQSSFQIIGNKMYLPAQYKSAYKIRLSKYIYQSVPIYNWFGAIIGYDYVRTNNTEPFDRTCYFDTRVQPISGTGANCSKALATVADNASICDTTYPEARSLMNPGIAQILQPFHEADECQSFTCANGRVVELCGCDATGNGVVLSSLDSLSHATQYIDYSNTSHDPINGAAAYLSDCARGNVIFFDPPSGGSVTLDNPDGDTIVLPPYPVTLVVRGADLRIKDNLVYPPNSNASLGVILLENDVCGATYGGDAFLHPDPTNVVGAYYLEGSLKSTDASWHIPAHREGTEWYKTFKNQILWEGTILSLNSIGGAVNPNWPATGKWECASRRPYEIGGGFPDPTWSESVEYDLAYLREYFRCGNLTSQLVPYGDNWKISGCENVSSPYSEIVYDESGAKSANGTTAAEAVVLRYDSRIQNNTPPGFSNFVNVLQTETGR